MGWMYQVYELVSNSISVVYLLTAVIGTVIAWKYRWLSPWIFLIVGGFAGFAAQSGGWLSMRLTRQFSAAGLLSQDVLLAVYVLNSLLGLAAQIALVLGVALVFRDLRDRQRQLEESLPEGARDESLNDEIRMTKQ